MILIGMTPPNPFEFGRELGPGELADREEEVAELRDALLTGGKLFLTGPRRYGKTSVQHAGAALARRRGAMVLRYNVEAFPTTAALLARIVSDSAREVRGSVTATARLIESVFERLRPQVTYKPIEQTWSVSLGIGAKDDPVPGLAEVLDGLEALAAHGRRRVGLVLDEIQHLVAAGEPAERQLRAAVQGHRHVGYVFSGSATALLTRMTSDPARPFYRLGKVRVLGAIPRPAFSTFLRRGFAPLRVKVTAEGLSTLFDEAGDVPYNVQLLAHHCWEALRQAGKGAVLTPALVRAAHARAARELDPLYSQQWLALTPPQRRALHALVLEGGTGLLGKAVATRFGLTASTMQKSLTALVEKGLCRRELHEGEATLRLEDPLLAAWVRTTIEAPEAEGA